MLKHLRYSGFISYSQKDSRIVRRLHRKLESFQLPEEFRTAAVDPKTGKIGRFFRDDDELSATADLSKAIQEALRQSAALIVVCSPNAAKSKWVNEEIRMFRELGRSDRVYAVIIEGEPNSGRLTTECFPPLLLGQGQPLAVNLQNETLPSALNRLVAGLKGIPFDSLWRRQERARKSRRNKVYLYSSVAASLSLVLLVEGARVIDWAFNYATVTTAMEASKDATLSSGSRLRLATLAVKVSKGKERRTAALDQLAQVMSSAPHIYYSRRPLCGEPLFFSKDGTRYLARTERGPTKTNSKQIEVLDTASCDVVSTLQSAPLHLSPHGRFSAAGGRVATFSERSAYLWDVATGDLIFEADFDERVHRIDGDQTFQSLLIGTNQLPGSVGYFWNGQLLINLEITQPARAITRGFNRSGDHFYLSIDYGRVNNDGGAVLVYNTEGNLVARRDFAADWNPSYWSLGGGELLVLEPEGQAFYLWDPHRNELLASIKTEHEWRHAFAGRDPHEFWLFSEQELALWDIESGSKTRSISSRDMSRFDIDFESNRAVTTHFGDASARLWDLSNGNLVKTLTGHSAELNRAAFYKTSRKIWTYSFDDTLRLWEAETGRQLATLSHIPNLFRTYILSDGETIVTQDWKDHGFLWTAQKKKEVTRINADSVMRSPEFNAEGTQLVTVADGSATLWDSMSGIEIWETRAFGGDGISDATFHPHQNTMVVAGAGDSLLVLDTRNGSVLGEIETRAARINSVRYSADGRWLVATSYLGRSAQIWDADSGEHLAILQHTDYVNDAFFSPDGKRLITRTDGGSVQNRLSDFHIWDIADRKLISSRSGSSSAVISHLGKSLLISKGADGVIGDWGDNYASEIETSLDLPLQNDWFASLELSQIDLIEISPSKGFASYASKSSTDRSVRVWKLSTGDPPKLMFDVAGNDLSFGRTEDHLAITGIPNQILDLSEYPELSTEHDSEEPPLIQMICNETSGRLSGGLGILSDTHDPRNLFVGRFFGRDVCEL